MAVSRLLYLGFAFPPGLQAVHPTLNVAGHAFETQMIAALRDHFEIRSTGLLPVEVKPGISPESSPGVNHDLLLIEKPPEVVSRQRALAQLKRQYIRWRDEGWIPDAVMVYNLSPVYSGFIRWLKRQSPRPKLVLLLLDSPTLGERLSALKKLRYRLKPLTYPEDEMLGCFDACVGLSPAVERYFSPRQIPFLWMPGGCTPSRADSLVRADDASANVLPIRFGFFGWLGPHTGILELLEVFRGTRFPNALHICGGGKAESVVANAAVDDKRIQFHGLLPTPDDCLQLAQSWDVLINPRPAIRGNENNFPSKIFDYALCGCSILSTRLAGIERVLGPEAFYFDERDFAASLRSQLLAIADMSRAELRRRGSALRARIARDYSWSRQASEIAQFLQRLN